jgi:hypothetical protein
MVSAAPLSRASDGCYGMSRGNKLLVAMTFNPTRPSDKSRGIV